MPGLQQALLPASGNFLPPGAPDLPPCTGTIPMAWQVLATLTGKGLARPLPPPSSFLQNGLNFTVKRMWTPLTLKTQEA